MLWLGGRHVCDISRCAVCCVVFESSSVSSVCRPWAGGGRRCLPAMISRAGGRLSRGRRQRGNWDAKFNAGVASQCTRGLTGKRGCLRLCRPKSHVHQQYHQEIHQQRRQDCRTDRCAAAPAAARTPSNTWVSKVSASCSKGLTS